MTCPQTFTNLVLVCAVCIDFKRERVTVTVKKLVAPAGRPRNRIEETNVLASEGVRSQARWLPWFYHPDQHGSLKCPFSSAV